MIFFDWFILPMLLLRIIRNTWQAWCFYLIYQTHMKSLFWEHVMLGLHNWSMYYVWDMIKDLDSSSWRVTLLSIFSFQALFESRIANAYLIIQVSSISELSNKTDVKPIFGYGRKSIQILIQAYRIWNIRIQSMFRPKIRIEDNWIHLRRFDSNSIEMKFGKRAKSPNKNEDIYLKWFKID